MYHQIAGTVARGNVKRLVTAIIYVVGDMTGLRCGWPPGPQLQDTHSLLGWRRPGTRKRLRRSRKVTAPW